MGSVVSCGTLQERGLARTIETKVPIQTVATVTGAGCDAGHTCSDKQYTSPDKIWLPPWRGIQVGSIASIQFVCRIGIFHPIGKRLNFHGM